MPRRNDPNWPDCLIKLRELLTDMYGLERPASFELIDDLAEILTGTTGIQTLSALLTRGNLIRDTRKRRSRLKSS